MIAASQAHTAPMPVIPLDKLDPAGRYTTAIERLLGLTPGIVISAGQASSGKVTSLLALVLRAQRDDQRVTLLTDQRDHFGPFLPLPPRWDLVTVEQTSAAWQESLASRAGTDDLLVVAPLDRENAKGVLAAASRPRWIYVAVDTALAGLDLSYVLRDMGVGYADFADAVRGIWSIFLLPALCERCATEVTLDPAEAELLAPGRALAAVKVETGCPHCNGEGTEGRVALSDITIIDDRRRDAVRDALVDGDPAAVDPGFHMAAQDRARQYLAQGVVGLNTYREAIRRNPLLRAQHALQVVEVQAGRLAQSLWLDLDVLTALAERMATGVLVADESGRVSFANALAREAIDAPGELAIVDEHLLARSPRVSRLLHEALRVAVQSAPRATRIPLSTSGNDDADIFVTPLPTARGFARDTRRLALLLVAQSGHGGSMPSQEDLRQLFDLTPAEGKVALMLCTGRAPKEIARDLQLSIATVRSHLASLLAKTGTSRQVQLVRLLMSLPRRLRDAG